MTDFVGQLPCADQEAGAHDTQGATEEALTIGGPPPAHIADCAAPPRRAVSKRRGANVPTATRKGEPRVAPIAGLRSSDDHSRIAGSGEGQSRSATLSGAALSAQITGLMVDADRAPRASAGEGLRVPEGQNQPALPGQIAGRTRSASPRVRAGSGGGQLDAVDLTSSAPSAQIAGQVSSDIQGSLASNGEGHERCVHHGEPALPNPITGQKGNADHAPLAGGGEGLGSAADPQNAALSATCDALKALQRKRRFCIVSQSRIDRACEAFIATQLGYTHDMDPAARKAVWAKASTIRKDVEAGREGHFGGDGHIGHALSACRDIIIQSAVARSSWDSLRNVTEKEMKRLAKTLHVYPWVKGITGFGDLGLGIIIGETGDLSIYSTKEKVWKRLGLAVIDGFRQQRRTNPEEALAHGFNPKRRAEIWTIGDSMFRHQIKGATETEKAQAKGPYGACYLWRKARTEGREWTPKHRDNDARRIMTKFLIENLWRVWNGKQPISPENFGMPRSDVPDGMSGERAMPEPVTEDCAPAPDLAEAPA